MLFKKLLFLSLMGVMCFVSNTLKAQQDATISPDQIQYWIGEGDNEVVLVVNFGDPDAALAWGYRFSNPSVTVIEVLESVVNDDPRLDYEYQSYSSYVEDIWYFDEEMELYNTGMGWMYNVNGIVPSANVSSKYVEDGDYIKFGDFGVGVNVGDFEFVWPTEIVPATDPMPGPTPVDATIAFDEILYWVGQGENEVAFIVNWNNPDVALAWGYRFDGESVVVKDVMDAIVAADPRFNYDASSGFLTDITYNDEELNLATVGMYWMYLVNGATAMLTMDVQTVADGDYIKWGDESCGTPVGEWDLVWTTEVVPVSVPASTPVDATIAFDEILYWVGQGENEVAFIVNWNNPDVALAWGYRFDGESVVVKDVMDAIVAADPRFNYDASSGFLTDITYNDEELNLATVGMYWMYLVNGATAMLTMDVQTVADGDYIKWGDESCGTPVGEWDLVWTTEVVPVPIYLNVDENHALVSSLYPNPASSYSMISLKGNNECISLTISDMQGRIVSQKTLLVNGQENVVIDTDSYNSGVYFINIKGDNMSQTHKLIVK